mmetsp:Transcript_69711/g.192775  ORF Transcript_69711/g.192775 Transcript_69711/m.192775 type:complete len:271 (-) Transcript_69711:85-897(-)
MVNSVTVGTLTSGSLHSCPRMQSRSVATGSLCQQCSRLRVIDQAASPKAIEMHAKMATASAGRAKPSTRTAAMDTTACGAIPSWWLQGLEEAALATVDGERRLGLLASCDVPAEPVLLLTIAPLVPSEPDSKSGVAVLANCLLSSVYCAMASSASCWRRAGPVFQWGSANSCHVGDFAPSCLGDAMAPATAISESSLASLARIESATICKSSMWSSGISSSASSVTSACMPIKNQRSSPVCGFRAMLRPLKSKRFRKSSPDFFRLGITAV